MWVPNKMMVIHWKICFVHLDLVWKRYRAENVLDIYSWNSLKSGTLKQSGTGAWSWLTPNFLVIGLGVSIHIALAKELIIYGLFLDQDGISDTSEHMSLQDVLSGQRLATATGFHAIAGFDTTSSFFNRSKKSACPGTYLGTTAELLSIY